MNFKTVSSSRHTCPTWGWGYTTVPVSSGQIISVGFQNFGFAPYLYATQMFTWEPLNQALVQVNNLSPVPTDWLAWVVVAYGDDEEEPTLLEPKVEQGKLEPEAAAAAAVTRQPQG